MKRLLWLLRLGASLEDALLTALLALMILLACAQILLRNLFNTGLVWADGLLQVAVLWIGMLGAMAAAREDNHISMDVVARFVPPRWRMLLKLLSNAVAALVCAVLAWQSLLLVLAERSAGSTGALRIPVWIFQSILPLGFGVIAWRCGMNFWRALRHETGDA
ncbi:MAG: TRAP transporter small permease [Deltaproteobacteria bacterium]|nr:TRAP transporter small permease [Deltaproteobacteria bacterium]